MQGNFYKKRTDAAKCCTGKKAVLYFYGKKHNETEEPAMIKIAIVEDEAAVRDQLTALSFASNLSSLACTAPSLR